VPDSTIVRPATRDNIDGVRSIAHAYGNLGYWSRRPYYLDHEMESGRLLVAEDGGGGGMLAFVAVLERGGVAHLAELFVRPDRLGRGIGGRLLTEVMAGTEERVTFASSDPRALPLYVRYGMRSVEPLLYLRGDSRAVGLLPVAGVSVEAADPDDVLGLDARASGRGRSEDIAFL
jgi:GNAT superfamily N-acetyltransferase